MGKCGRKCVGAPHPNTLPYTSPIPLPISLPLTPIHFSTHPYTFPHFSSSTPHTSFLTHPHAPTHFPTPPPYLFPQLSSPPLLPNTLPHSPHALSHIFPHSFDYVAKLPCDDVTVVNLTGLWKNPIKFLTTTGNLKSC